MEADALAALYAVVDSSLAAVVAVALVSLEQCRDSSRQVQMSLGHRRTMLQSLKSLQVQVSLGHRRAMLQSLSLQAQVAQ